MLVILPTRRSDNLRYVQVTNTSEPRGFFPSLTSPTLSDIVILWKMRIWFFTAVDALSA